MSEVSYTLTTSNNTASRTESRIVTEPFEPIDTLAGPGEAKTNAQTLARLLGEVFPEAVTEDGIDFEALKQLVGEEALPSTAEKFGLSWPGKAASRRLALLPPTGTLLPRPDESVEWDSTRNIVIEGDNLESLRILRRSYAGKIKLVYIDPPYNTGNEFVYNDSFADGVRAYEEFTKQRDENGKLAANTESSGRKHQHWLSMMHPRLRLAHDLLRSDGIIAISIDENEIANLTKLAELVFGEANHVATLIWKNKKGGGNDSKHFAIEHEYIVVFAKNITSLPPFFTQFDSKYLERYKEEDQKGRFFWDTFLRKSGKQYYPITAPDGTVLEFDSQGRPVSWLRSEARFHQDLADGEVRFVQTSGNWSVHFKQRIPEGKKPRTIVDDRGVTADGSTEVDRLLSPGIFDNPKPTQLLRWILEWATPSGGLVLDFFAGSGTLGHAVMEQCAQDGVDRRFILVQLDEPAKGGSHDSIASITRERLRRAGNGIADAQGLNAGNLDLGFRSYHLAESNTRKWDGTIGEQSLEDAVATAVDNLLPGRTTDDLLVEMMLRLGLELTTPVEQQDVAGSPLYNLGAGTMFAYFGTDITVDESKQIAQAIRTWRDEEGPVTEAAVVVRDTGFADSAAKLNLAAALNQAGITNLRSI